MKHGMLTAKTIVSLLGLLTSIGCMGTSREELIGTAVAETRTAIAVAKTARVTPTPFPKVALLSFHGRWVTAIGGGGGWLLRQEPEPSDCGWFTLHHLDNGKVALVTCHDRYVTAPKTGVTRSDWRLWQESELDDCGQFVLYDLGGDHVAVETCAGNILTAGDGGWPGELAWAIVGETDDIKDWERFKMLQPYTLLQSMVVNFDSCTGVTKLGGQMGAAYDPSSGDRLVESYVQEVGHGCIARLEYDIVDWGGFWIQLQGADLSPYNQLVFDAKVDSQEVPERVKIELKRAGGQEVSILYISGITTDWQTMGVNLRDFEGSLSSFTDMEELVFTFEANGSRKTGVIHLDNIALRRE
jgi:hypothetical protein